MSESETIPPNFDPASWVSMVRDWLVPRCVQGLIDRHFALGRELGIDLIDRSQFRQLREDVRDIESFQKLYDWLFEHGSRHDLLAVYWCLRMLERDCHEGEVDELLPESTLQVVCLAIQRQVDLGE